MYKYTFKDIITPLWNFVLVNFHELFRLQTLCLGKVSNKEIRFIFCWEKKTKTLLCMDYVLKLQYVPIFFSSAEHPKAVA